MKIYTRSGDDGTTGLFAGGRVSKNDLRIEAFGTVDELNAMIGMVLSHNCEQDLEKELHIVQENLFSIGAQLATQSPDRVAITPVSDQEISELESWIDLHESELPQLTQFILPGGTPAAAALHVARTIARRSERCIVSLEQTLNAGDYSNIIAFMNRLSDYLFVISRVTNHRLKVEEPIWRGQNR